MHALFVVARANQGFVSAVEVYGSHQEAMDAAQGMLLACDYRPDEDDVQVFLVDWQGKTGYVGAPMLTGQDVELMVAGRK